MKYRIPPVRHIPRRVLSSTVTDETRRRDSGNRASFRFACSGLIHSEICPPIEPDCALLSWQKHIRDTITFEELTNNRTTEHAVTRALEIIGEASENIPEQVKDEYPYIPWKFMAGLRDTIIHGYFAINYENVVDGVQHKLPDLEPQIQAVWDAMKPDAFR